MKTSLSLALAMLASLFIPQRAAAQGTAFTYQGRLNANGTPVSGLYDLRFKLYVDPLGNTQVGSPVLTNGAPVANGLFTVTLDFGAGVFTGTNFWLEVDVKTNGGAAYADLSPLQAVTPTPYAVFAENVGTAGLAGTFGGAVTFNNAANQFSGTFSGNGASVSNVNAATFGGLTPGNFWQLGGNNLAGGQFLGSLNNQPMEIWAGQARAFRLERDTNGFGGPNVIGGAANNFVDPGVFGATIAGGGVVNYSAAGGYETGPGSNHISAIWGSIGGGRRNTVGADHSTIAGGHDNQVQGFSYDSVIGGGTYNLINSNSASSVIAGGGFNQAGAYGTAVGGGVGNVNNEGYSAIAGGQYNSIQVAADHAFIGGGGSNTVVGSATLPVYSVIAGGFDNLIKTNGSYLTLSGGSFGAIGANCFGSTLAGGSYNSIGDNSTAAVIGGGTNNNASSTASTVAGGAGNTANYFYATVGGGSANTASGSYATVPGGNANAALGGFSFAAGLQAQALHLGSFVWADASGGVFPSTAANQFSVRALGGIRLAGDVQLDASTSHYLSLNGGNSLGFLYGSYARWQDGIHLGYNYYADAIGGSHIINPGGGTSRISAGYNSIVLATGGTGVQPTYQNLVIGGTTTTVNGTFNNNSDRNAKQDFATVSQADLLDRVLGLPLSQWSYKADPTTRHIGPMAQDFYSAFRVGTDDKHIAPIDEGGVALAAIQGLNQKVESGNRKAENEMAALKAENAQLKARLEKLEQLIENEPNASRSVSSALPGR